MEVWDVGAGLSARSLLGSSPAPSANVFVAARPAGRGGFMARAALGGSVGGDSIPAGSVAFDLAAVQLSACAPSLGMGSLGLRACVSGELGYLVARGRGDRFSGDSQAVPWATGGATGELSWPEESPLRITVAGGPRAALLRHRFYFAPDTTVYRMSLIGGELGASVSLEMP